MIGKTNTSDKLVTAYPCETCGVPAVVRISDQHFCGSCAMDYQRAQLDDYPVRTQTTSPNER